MSAARVHCAQDDSQCGGRCRSREGGNLSPLVRNYGRKTILHLPNLAKGVCGGTKILFGKRNGLRGDFSKLLAMHGWVPAFAGMTYLFYQLKVKKGGSL